MGSGLNSGLAKKSVKKTMRFPVPANKKLFYLAIFSIISMFLCIFSLVVYNKYAILQNINHNTFYQYEVLRQSRIVLLDTVDMDDSVRSYVVTGQDAYLKPYTAVDNRLRDDIA